MADYVQYHNTKVEGPVGKRNDGRCAIVTHKTDLEHLKGERIWLISGLKGYYWLESCFTVDLVEPAGGEYATALEGPGTSFRPAVQIDQHEWFKRLYIDKRRYSLGLHKIEPELVRELEKVRAKHIAHK